VGECINSIAHQYGFFPDTLWHHPDNAQLRALRKDMNILFPGDSVVVPDLSAHQESCAADTRHRFRRKGVPALFRLQLFDGDEPRAEQAYRLDIDGRSHEGVTDANGVLEVDLPPGARQGRLTVGEDNMRLEIDFGHLAPVDTIAGVQQRLNNLGFPCGEADGEERESLTTALLSFQSRCDLAQTGLIDDATRERLAAIHDQAGALPE
jgi:N-acetylmuramoyl-L-alanine amidase